MKEKVAALIACGMFALTGCTATWKGALGGAAAGGTLSTITEGDDTLELVLGGALTGALLADWLENNKPDADSYRYNYAYVEDVVEREYNYLYKMPVPGYLEEENWVKRQVIKSIKQVGDELLGNNDGDYTSNELNASLYEFRKVLNKRAGNDIEGYINANKDVVLIKMLTVRYQQKGL